jgi:hypothetical protein
MILNPIDLLARLASGILPDAAPAPQTSIDQAGFADLLEKVRAGELASSQPVEIAPGANVELSPEQLARLGVALDAAEAAGHDRVLALIDGKALTVDVSGRMVMESHSPADARVLNGFDAVISVPAGGVKDLRSLFAKGSRHEPQPSPLASLQTIRNQSLSEIIAPLSDDED